MTQPHGTYQPGELNEAAIELDPDATRAVALTQRLAGVIVAEGAPLALVFEALQAVLGSALRTVPASDRASVADDVLGTIRDHVLESLG